MIKREYFSSTSQKAQENGLRFGNFPKSFRAVNLILIKSYEAGSSAKKKVNVNYPLRLTLRKLRISL